ncbi:MAG: hypothetical protein ACYCZV_09515 [Acidimicrobiales bacterium]
MKSLQRTPPFGLGAGMAVLALMATACGSSSHVNAAARSGTTTSTAASSAAARSAGTRASSGASKTAAPIGGAQSSNATPAAAGGAATHSSRASSSSPPPAAGASLGPAQTPGAPHAPTPGTYQYKSTDSQGAVTQLKVSIKPAPGPAGATDQNLTISSPKGSESSDYAWGASGVMVSSTTLSGQQGSIQCNWNPDVTQYVFPIKVGSQWSSTSHCTTTVDGAPTQVTYTNQVMVSGIARIEEAGQVLDTWVIQRHAVLSAKSAAFTFNVDTVTTEYFAPIDGQTPKEVSDSTTSGSYAGKSFSSQTKATIEAETLSPA